MRRINLVPPEERRRGGGLQAPGGLLGLLLVSGAVVVVLMVGLYLFNLIQLNTAEEEIADLDSQISEQNQRLAELSPFRDLEARLQAIKPIADGIVRTRFPWDEFLRGLTFVIPESTALDSFTGEAAPVNVDAAPGETLAPGTITFTGIALPQYRNVADFVVQMNNLRFLADSSLSSAELDRETFAEPAINFEVLSQLVTRVGETGIDALLGGQQDGQDSTGEPTQEPSGEPTQESGGGTTSGSAGGGSDGGDTR